MSPAAATGGASVLGVDIGGTKTIAAIVGPDGKPGPSARAAAAIGEPRAVLDTAIGTARNVLAEHRQKYGTRSGFAVRACGVGTAGTVGPDGIISYATDTLPGWAGTDVRAAFTSALDLPTVVRNDVHAAALGEYAHGAAQGHGTALIIWLGTGIGGAIIHAGAVLVGRTSTAGSVGHVPVPAASIAGDRRQCTCGAWDHLEAHASGPAIRARYVRLASAEDVEQASQAAADVPAIAELARAGDSLALQRHRTGRNGNRRRAWRPVQCWIPT